MKKKKKIIRKRVTQDCEQPYELLDREKKKKGYFFIKIDSIISKADHEPLSVEVLPELLLLRTIHRKFSSGNKTIPGRADDHRAERVCFSW